MKSANRISQMGRKPYSAAPMPTPTIESSASGESMTRFSPYLANSPWVARNTPPRGPTSSPTINTRSSRASSSSIARRMASTIVISGMMDLFDVYRSQALNRGVWVGRSFRTAHSLLYLGRCLCLSRLLGCLAQHVHRLQLRAKKEQRVALLPLLHLFARAVGTVIVVRGMRHRAVGLRFHQRRPLPAARAVDGLLHHALHRQHVVAVHHHTRHAECGGAGGHVSYRHLPILRLGDGVHVVLHHAHHRQFVDRRPVQALVPFALRGRAFADRRYDDSLVALQFDR